MRCRPVSLDGTSSFDPDGDLKLSYHWQLVLAPGGSAASISNPNSATASLVPDLGGLYQVSLTVTDSHGFSSGPILVSFTATFSTT